MKKIIAALSLMFPLVCSADFVSCGNVKISLVSVQGERDDNMSFANKLILRLKDASGSWVSCGGKSFIHLNSIDATFAYLMSMALTASTKDLVVSVAVNTSKATELSNQLSVITFEK